MFAAVHNSKLPQFMSLVQNLEHLRWTLCHILAGVVDEHVSSISLAETWIHSEQQGHSCTPGGPLNSVSHICCVWTIRTYCSKPGNSLDWKSYHQHSFRCSCSISAKQGSQKLLNLLQPQGDPRQTECKMTGGSVLLAGP